MDTKMNVHNVAASVEQLWTKAALASNLDAPVCYIFVPIKKKTKIYLFSEDAKSPSLYRYTFLKQ